MVSLSRTRDGSQKSPLCSSRPGIRVDTLHDGIHMTSASEISVWIHHRVLNAHFRISHGLYVIWATYRATCHSSRIQSRLADSGLFSFSRCQLRHAKYCPSHFLGNYTFISLHCLAYIQFSRKAMLLVSPRQHLQPRQAAGAVNCALEAMDLDEL